MVALRIVGNLLKPGLKEFVEYPSTSGPQRPPREITDSHVFSKILKSCIAMSTGADLLNHGLSGIGVRPELPVFVFNRGILKDGDQKQFFGPPREKRKATAPS